MKRENRFSLKWIICGLLVGLALICIFLLPGYDFSGYFFLGLASLIPLYHVLRNHKFMTITLTVCLIIFFIAVAITGYKLFACSYGWEQSSSDYVIVLGAGVNGTEPSRTLRERLDAAYEFLLDHPDTVAIVSGGKGDGENISEAQCMYNYLTAAGIDPDRVWMEDQATNTIENLQFSLDVVESRTGDRPVRVAIISSEYHLYRAEMFAKQLGLEPELFRAKTEILPLRWNYYLREVFAVWYYSLFGG